MSIASKVHSVSHLNSYAPTGTAKSTAAALYAKLARGEKMNENGGKIEGFMRNPTLVKQEAEAMQDELRLACDALHDDASRVAEAEDIKVVANGAFSAASWRVALIGYVTAIWQLRHGSRAAPTLVAHVLASGAVDDEECMARLKTLPSWLRGAPQALAPASDGAADDADGAARDGAAAAAAATAAAALRLSLHLNLAAAALKLSEWDVAKAACEAVLSTDAQNAKALFRLAKAHEGEGELAKALAALVALLKCDAKNGDARRLHEVLRKRHLDERSQYAGIFAARAPAAIDVTPPT